MKTHTIEDIEGVGSLTYIEGDDGALYISMFVVKRGHRMKGHGGRLLSKICQLADKRGCRLYLSVSPMDHGPDTLPYGLLADYYMRRGFAWSKGYGSRMVREPLQSIATPDRAG